MNEVRIFVGADAVAAIPPGDRGTAYGDGLFETMRTHRGEVPWWDAHWARLQQGAARLRMALPDAVQVRREAGHLLDDRPAVLKLIVTRGRDGRGYAPAGDAAPTWILSRHPLPPTPPPEGLALRWCNTRLAVQPALAGIKHCNRLEQVLARGEWNDMTATGRDAHEGLMFSTEGDVVSATAANLFVLRDGRWSTPPVDRCGVAGICRGWAIAALDATEVRLGVTDVETADAVFLCNAVRGILPVARLGTRRWSSHPQLIELQRRLAAEHPAFEFQEVS
ncbi:MAG TPA: aminodeoxychorismate lyase [Lysobacter sp.]